MPEIKVDVLEETATSLEQLSEHLARVQKNLRYLLGGNIDADNIIAKSITANQIQAGTITADLITVNELSAITANLGHITAGLIESVQIFGSYIATSTSFPKVELSNTTQQLKASGSATTSVEIISDPATLGQPALRFINGSSVAIQYLFPDEYLMFTDGDMRIIADNLTLPDSTRLGISTPFGSLTLPTPTGTTLEELQNDVLVMTLYLKAIGLFQ